MEAIQGRLTVLFEEPFWVGIFERYEDGRLSVCKVTFGAEPTDNEVLELILKAYGRLKFSPAVAAMIKEPAKNPKRRQREIRKSLENAGIGTKSQQALQLQREQNKPERRQISKEQKEAEAERRYELRLIKKKKKKKGH